jgi:hypothetical protein
MWVPYIRELVKAPACKIGPVQFIEGWQNGKPINPSAEYSGKDPYKIQVYWELKETSCSTPCQVVWFNNNVMICSHPYGSLEIPHEDNEGSMYYNDDNNPLEPGAWRVEVRCGSEVVGEAEAIINP